MTSTASIQFKQSSTTAAGPTTLLFGEPAWFSDGTTSKLWIGDKNGAKVAVYPQAGTTYTASHGVQLIGSDFQAQADTAGANKLPVTVGTGGLSVAYDNITIQASALSQLAVKAGTAGPNLVPVDVSAGVNIPIDNVTVQKNGSGQLVVAAINGGTF